MIMGIMGMGIMSMSILSMGITGRMTERMTRMAWEWDRT